MEEFPSTGEINTAVDEQPSHFGATTGTGTSLPYYDGAHAIVLFSISHVGMPPIALDPREPAVRFYGCFENRAMASAFAKRVVACDPTCNIQMGDTHKWILACSTAERCNDAAYADAKIARLVAHHAQATESTKDAFIARSAELRKAGPEPEVKTELNQVNSTDTQINTATAVLHDTPSDILQPQAQTHLDSSTKATKATDLSTTVHTDEQTSVTTDAAEIKTPTATGSFLDSSCTLAFQSVLCVAFVKDELDPSEPEFMFKVFRSCKDETEAGGYIKAVASKHITDHSIDVVDMCSWGFPQSETAIQTTYRNKQLDDIMRNDPVLPTW